MMIPRFFNVVHSEGAKVVGLLLPDQPSFHWGLIVLCAVGHEENVRQSVVPAAAVADAADQPGKFQIQLTRNLQVPSCCKA
jgi:hypothetical protein